MNVITLDFETHFTDTYSLRKMTTEAYIRDPRFQALGVGIRYPEGANGLAPHLHEASFWIGEDIERELRRIDWSTTACLCHHAQFDGLILSHHYGIKPAFWLDTLSMARLVVGNHLSVGLDSLAKHYGLAGKSIDYASFKGKYAADLVAVAMHKLGEGCIHDLDLTWDLFHILSKGFPQEEYRVIDQTVRMFCEPVLEGDTELLAQVWLGEETRKHDMLKELGVSSDDLQSSERFAELLRAEGIEPDTKASPTGAGQIYAFAKTDDFMKELIEDDTRAGALGRARLGVRSTIDQTRAASLGWMATRGSLPVYLRYAGAHTTRWSGGDSLNWQNFRRGSDIRRAIKAPPGRALIVLDLAQIECRILNVLAGEEDVVTAFRTGRDLYSETASVFYGRTITKSDNTERHLGKVLELGCGYGMGLHKLRATCKQGALGGAPIILSEIEADAAVGAYRSSHPYVVNYWGTAGRVIARIAGGDPMEWGPMLIKDKRVYLPNGAWLNYDTLEYDQDERQWRYRTRQGWTKLYGGKLVENVVQALARVVLSQAMLRMQDMGHRPVNSTHDEVLFVVKADGSEYAEYEKLKAEMERPPSWLPELPLKVEGGVSERYDK